MLDRYKGINGYYFILKHKGVFSGSEAMKEKKVPCAHSENT